ncbi:hypothetical protein NIES4071_107950 (plasmid) [Calothrix sp. NIES-4071]|nr:hypothetical protein NIES4071_107950 [Calothrix sp. NIES-4071]BAZ64835.1 hypothetical protein NIES4105_105680 [Calothrix sp. NIES-4105]
MSKKPKGWYKDIVLRPVLNVDGYMPYEKICGHVADVYYSVDPKSIERQVLDRARDSLFISTYTLFKVGQAKCPAYWVNSDLLAALAQSDLSVEAENLNWAMETGIFMLPIGAVLSPENYAVQALYWHCDKERSLLYWAATDGINIFCRRYRLEDNERKIRHIDAQELDSETVVDFNEYLQSIFLRLLLIMEARPEYVDTTSERVIVNKGFSKSSEKDYYKPLWIGKEYRLRKEGNTENTGTSTGSSKSMHWRRGYLRNQAYGEGRSKRKLIWIEPVLVMGSASDL